MTEKQIIDARQSRANAIRRHLALIESRIANGVHDFQDIRQQQQLRRELHDLEYHSRPSMWRRFV